MIWILLLFVAVLVVGVGVYRKNGEGYSAGRGMFINSEDNLDSKNVEDLTDYEPFNFEDMRK